MKALILWARDHHPDPYKLRIENKSDTQVTGTVQIHGEWVAFCYDRGARVIALGGDDARQEITINEWGWEQ